MTEIKIAEVDTGDRAIGELEHQDIRAVESILDPAGSLEG